MRDFIVGDRGYNAGGWNYMSRVWCPDCGKSYLVGWRKFQDSGTNHQDLNRPLRPCSHKPTCLERKRKRDAKKSKS